MNISKNAAPPVQVSGAATLVALVIIAAMLLSALWILTGPVVKTGLGNRINQASLAPL